MAEQEFIRFFDQIRIADLAAVGGKNASLGEMYTLLTAKGIRVPYGFALTTAAYWEFIYRNRLNKPIADTLAGLNRKDFSNLRDAGKTIRDRILEAPLPSSLRTAVGRAYAALCDKYAYQVEVAVRSSATAEDLPSASFAGLHQSFLNIRGEGQLLLAVHHCFASLFTDRAIKYREDHKIGHEGIGLSVGVQKMVRSDLACSGIAFTLEPESGFKNIVHIAGSWGLGENIVQGTVSPDEFLVFKPALRNGKKAIVSKKLGTKAKTMVYADHTDHEPSTTICNTETPAAKRDRFVLNDAEVLQVAQWALIIEGHYGRAMDIEWAKDGMTHELFMVQARPETIHQDVRPGKLVEYTLKEEGPVLASGSAIGNRIASGLARILSSPLEADKLRDGEVLITDMTNPDWDPILKKASAIITNKGGRTSHASIVARELGVVAVVGTGNATSAIADGQAITVSCAEGKTGFVYQGNLKWEEKEFDLSAVKMPKTRPMLILGDPEKAFKYSFYPNDGVGLMRLEFIISNSIGIHPMALARFSELKDRGAKEKIAKLARHYPDKKNYFTDKLSQAVAIIACAFHPKEVIVRMSDFKSNEYANLTGGKQFELQEENPMLGFRGASRYYDERYKDGFRLECEAMKIVRNEMGLTNVKLMIPFCRTIEEGRKVIAVMEEFGLKRGENGLEIYVMAEIPSNVLLAEQFAELFDGFSIGSNDLTQLTLGIDRDNAVISTLFSEKNDAATQMIALMIRKAKNMKAKIGLCGQAPSDFPEFARFLVKEGIDSISFSPDALLKGIANINAAEGPAVKGKKYGVTFKKQPKTGNNIS
ncbi:MAG: phosphoenolpyruvate synthase [Bacteroidota bacterium]